MSTPTPCPDQLTLYLVAWTDDDSDNRDAFVTARNKLEAFALWRADQGLDPKEFHGMDIQVVVYDIPARGSAPVVHVWDHRGAESFPMDLDTLATRAAVLGADAHSHIALGSSEHSE